jgi:NAD(P) transhydrogenase
MQDSGHHDFDLVVIGSGPAGQHAAVLAAMHGRRVAIIERQELVGGVCVHTGTMPSKALREAVLGLTGWQLRGLFPARREQPADPVTMSDLRAHIDHVIAREIAAIERRMSRHGVEVLFGHARFVGTHAVEVESHRGRREATSTAFLIATGTTARRPAWVPFDDCRVIDSDQVCSMCDLPRRMVILGGGVIALEYASVFALLGIEVHVVNRGARVLGFIDHDLMEVLIPVLEKRGVVFHDGAGVKGVTANSGRSPTVSLESGESIETDVVIVALGRRGTAGDLGLDAVGVTPNEDGVLSVDGSFRTSAPHISAAGDVIGQPATASTARNEGVRAARHLLGLPAESGEPDLLPYGIYTVPEMSYVGSTERELESAGTPFRAGKARYREVAKGEIIGDETGLVKLLFHRGTERLLGVHIIGSAATDLVQLGHAVMTFSGTASYFRDAVFNYPSLSECYRIAALDATSS